MNQYHNVILNGLPQRFKRLRLALAGWVRTVCVVAAGILFLTAGPGRAGNTYFNVPGGSDITMLEMCWPYPNGGVYNPWVMASVSSSGATSMPFYFGDVMPDSNGASQMNYSFWPISNPLNPGDQPTVVYTATNMFSPVGDTGEGVAGHAGGVWAFQTNQWYRYVLRVWTPADGTTNLGYMGGWIRWPDGSWHHCATVETPFTATGITGADGFQENFGSSTTPWQTQYRNCYYHLSGSWAAANQFTAGANGGWLVNAGVISNGTVAYLECCPSNNTVGYVGTPFNNDIPLTMTNQPAAPTFDPLIVTNATAAVYGGQVLVQWQVPPVSSPQLGCKIEVFNNSNYTGSAAVTWFDRNPETKLMVLAIPGVTTPYVRLTVSDIFNNTNAPVLITPSITTLNPATNVTGTVSGLGYAYYQSATNYGVLPNFAALTPALRGAVNNPDLTPRLTRTDYAFNYNGFLNVPTNGLYTFTLNSYDGSQLLVDGATVINNDGEHSLGSQVGVVGLAAGWHALTVQYFMDTDNGYAYDDVMSLAWAGPGLAETNIPDSAYGRVPAVGEPVISLVSPAGGGTMDGSNVVMSAAVTSNGVSVTAVQFYAAGSCLAQTTAAPYAGNVFFGNSPTNTYVRARLVYNGTNTLDSPALVFATTNMNLGPWQFAPLDEHVYPAAAKVAGGTLTLTGDSINLLGWQVASNCTLVAHLAGFENSGAAPDGSTPPLTQCGIILRGNTNDTVGYPLGNSDYGTRFAAVYGESGGGGTYFQDDTMKNGGGAYGSANLGGTNTWFKLVRTGDLFTSYVSPDGTNWTWANTNTLTGIGYTIYAAMFTYTLQSLNPIIPQASLDNFNLSGNVAGAPSASIMPGSASVYTGQSASFTSTAIGNPPLTWQWADDGVAIPGATNSTLTLTNLQPGNSGVYSLTIADSDGSTTGSGAMVTVSSLPTGTANYAAAVVSNTPYAYWHLNETSGTTAADSSGNGRNGTYAHAILGQAGPQPPSFPGFWATNLAAGFNGTNSGVSCGTAASLSGATDFSVTAWIKTTATSNGVVIQQRDGSGNGYNGEYGLSVNGTVNFYVSSNAISQFSITPAQAVNDGQWHHLAAVRSGTIGYVYIDGALAGSGAGTERLLNPTAATYLGYDQRNGNSYFNGTIGDVAIFGQALSAAAVQGIYSAGVVPPPSLVTLTAPANGASFYGPTNLALGATVNTNGHTLNYVQFYNGTNLLGQVGGTPANLVWSNLAPGTYTVLAQAGYDGTNGTTSAPAVITVAPVVAITAQPQSQTNLAGSTVSFSVGAGGAPPLAYQWWFNHALIPGATNAVLTLTNCQAGQSGNYLVTVTAGIFSNASVTSSPAALAVYPPPASPAAVLTNGPVAYWRLNETNGTTAYDSSPNGNNATYANCGLGLAGPQPPAFPGFDPENLAVNFNGSNSRMACPAAVSVNGAANFTVLAWVKTTATNGGAIIQQRDGSGAGYAGEYQLAVNGTVSFYVYSNNYQFNLTTTRTVNDGNWHQIAGVRSGTGGYIYIDGTLAKSGSGTVQSLNPSIATWIGYDERDGNYYFNGLLDEVAVFSNALSSATIQGIYQQATNRLAVYDQLNYTPGANGTLTGTAVQTVTNGGNGTAVTAVANTGYHFVNWTDGSTANPRTDTGVTNNLAVMANFAQNNQPGVVLSPRITSARMAANGASFTLACTGSASQAYVLMSASNLTSPVWLPMLTNTANGTGLCNFTDLQVSNISRRFYRITVP